MTVKFACEVRGRNHWGGAYPYASFRGLGIRVAHRGNTLGFFVEEDDVGDGADLGAFVADIFFNVEDGGGVLLFGVSLSWWGGENGGSIWVLGEG